MPCTALRSAIRAGADADDVTQEVFLRLLRTRKSFESDKHVKNWLIRVTINECKRLLKHKRNDEPLDDYAGKPTA